MKCILLCGGYATRLLPLTKDKAKPLLEVDGKHIIDYTLEKLVVINEIDEIIISTNTKFEDGFKEWLSKKNIEKNIKLVIEETTEEEDKLGAIGGINFVLDQEKIDEDVIIIAGDNVFGFDIRAFIEFYKEKKSAIMAAFDVQNIEKAKLYGIVKIDENHKITNFEEKPSNPKSTLASTACYIYPKETLSLFKQYLNEGNSKDEPGFFLEWLYKKQDIFAFVFSNYWFDIGDFASLKEAEEFMNSENIIK